GCWWVPTVGRHICQISKFIWDQSLCRPTVGTHHQQQVPSAAGSDSSRETVEGGVGPVEGV
ncbi:hypothetical protein, partial [Stenotrophomonas sp.]|uniref:hypothetical protein n=1 Tax=Stenotrophomonas sp. TaxID=69392 RepID=UPI0028B02CF3